MKICKKKFNPIPIVAPFGKRSWKMFYCTLRDLVLYLHKDENGFRKSQVSVDTPSLHQETILPVLDRTIYLFIARCRFRCPTVCIMLFAFIMHLQQRQLTTKRNSTCFVFRRPTSLNFYFKPVIQKNCNHGSTP